jgi:hypothetical protein
MDSEIIGSVLAIPSTQSAEIILDTSIGEVRITITMPAIFLAERLSVYATIPRVIAAAVLRVTEASDG